MTIPQKIGLGLIALGFGVVVAIAPQYIKASDHDDGEVDTKGRNLNLTDLFVFREKDQNRSAAANDLIFVMNTNPRSLARQQYFFSTTARYEFKVTRVGNKNAQPTGREDVVLRFEFSPPTANGQQEFKLSAISDGTTRVATGKTTPLRPNPAAAPVINQLYLGGSRLTVFAGLREDPFFFDVEQYFRVRAGALGIGPEKAFRPPERAIDFTKGYNVNAIVVRIPRSFLRGYTAVNTFDVWQTIAVKDPVTDRFQQFERLARPVINEGLVVTNAFLNAFNMIPPTADLSAAAAPVRAEAKRTLLALGNSNTRADALLNAFLPDVMRIDTTIPSGYANALNTQGSPIAGRKLTDDVIDITLSVLTNGAITTDNVSYAGTPSNPAQGHKPLQTGFPYLALPN
ncbi:hypothetical protein BWI75_16310 [Gloeocapsopsis sp. AAB1 = 1H9]|uniref:DUF4331 domain-containing protein n=2 Tax=Gloeocapsopsis TaxID=693222 RepID=A0A6N8G116_9CHRO|nr:hypothetical protein [Gloeocapsopsis dulcis AAB1 = 1H9]